MTQPENGDDIELNKLNRDIEKLERELNERKVVRDIVAEEIEKKTLRERFESILIEPTSPHMVHKFELKVSKKNKKSNRLDRYFKQSLLKKLKLDPSRKIDPCFSWPLTSLAKMFQITLNHPTIQFYSLAEIFLAWSKSIDKGPPSDNSFQGITTNEITNVYFGVSPGFPQFVIRRGHNTNIEGALALGIVVQFDSFTYDDLGRMLPNHISTGLPPLPRREEMTDPLVIRNNMDQKKIEEQVRREIMDEKGNIDRQKLPISLVGLRNNWPDESKFSEAMENVSKNLGFKIVFENDKKKGKWPNTYRYILSWCLAYIDEGPPPGIIPEKNAVYVRSFPIYKSPNTGQLRDKNFQFCWFHSARGLVHDLALQKMLDGWKKEHHSSNRWLLLGDETGTGKELIKSIDEIKNTSAKKFAYIWVLVPPKIFPTQIASDFHAMNQEYFGRELVRVLTDLIETPESRFITFVFETDEHLDVDQKMSDGNDSPSATVLKATLPLIFEYVSQHTNENDDFECEISTISEQWDWLRAGADSNFLNIIGLDYFDHVAARGRGKFKVKEHEIVGKLDHPWLPYADAMGFMTNGPLPKSLENIKKDINDSLKILPIHLKFLNNEFPKLAQLLSNKPIKFLEELCSVDSKDIYAYMDGIIAGMIHNACERFEPIDWVSFNKLMIEQQSNTNGRIIAEQVTNWAIPELPELLNTLPTDNDRVNMCLTLGWSTEQQGGNVSQIIERISPDWLKSKRCSERNRLSLVRLIFTSRQNFFDFNTDSKILSESGILDCPSLTPLDMENILQNRSSLTEENVKILGTFFESFAHQGLKDNSLIDSLWKSNELFVGFDWGHRRDNRRHCIYGGEFAIDCAQHDAKWYGKAYQRLFEDFYNYFATGEDEKEELYWWPAALKYHSLRSDSEGLTLERDECELWIKKARKIADKSPPHLKIRLFYWMARLSKIYDIPGAEKHFDDLGLLVKGNEAHFRDVYIALSYVHLIDLCERHNSGTITENRREFSSLLENCSETTRAHFSEFLENPEIRIIDCLKFNYL